MFGFPVRRSREHRSVASIRPGEPPVGSAARSRRANRGDHRPPVADGIAEDDELRTLVAMLRGSVFQMLNDAGATDG
jgi:hypothetical protein